jgi:hypothetical protein
MEADQHFLERAVAPTDREFVDTLGNCLSSEGRGVAVAFGLQNANPSIGGEAMNQIDVRAVSAHGVENQPPLAVAVAVLTGAVVAIAVGRSRIRRGRSSTVGVGGHCRVWSFRP